MERLIEIRKELDVTQRIVAEHLKMDRSNYAKLEKKGLNDAFFNRVVLFLVMECSNRPTDRKTLGISQQRCADLLGIKKSNLCAYERKNKEVKGLSTVLEIEHNRRLQFKTELREMLK